MAYSSLPSSSGAAVPRRSAPPLPPSLLPPDAPRKPNSNALLSVLRQALAAGTHTIASILHAATDAARVLTGAQGTALALRTNAVIVCRARSGDIAPPLGVPLDVDSGISGECLRTATIQLCNDATTDDRVDPAVCRALGIRSIVVVPLLGPTGVAGILEAFSTSSYAFTDQQINSLRNMAEIAEAAYERECRDQDPPPALPTPAARRPALFAAPALENRGGAVFDQPSSTRRYWISAIAAVALLLISAVIWFTWHDPPPEIAALETPAQSTSAPQEAAIHAPPRLVPLKPDAGIPTRQSDRARTAPVMRNAADIESRPNGPTASPAREVSPPERTEETTLKSASPTAPSELPPSIEVAAKNTPDKLHGLAAAPAPLPALAVRVSQGVTETNLIHKVNPIYPPLARIQRLAGSVTLDATIAPDGAVREVKAISGPSALAPAALAAVRQWRYSPPLLNGNPIEVHKEITIVFKLP